MKLTIKHEGQIKTGLIPSWDSLTVKQFIALEAGNYSDLELLSILSGIDLTYIENTNADLSPAMEAVFKLFNNKPPDLSTAKKRPVTIEGKPIKFPKTLDFTRYGQKSMIKNLIMKEEDIKLIISEVFAIYCQPLLDGKFDSSRIPALKTVIDRLPILTVYPYTVFFLQKLNVLKNSLTNPWQLFQKQQPRMNRKPSIN